MGNSRRPPSQFERFQSFVDGLWDGSAFRFGKKLSRLERITHFWILVGRNFTLNRCPARAAALSYTTLLALIPMLAVVLSVTSGLLKGESEERIDQFIDKLVISLVPPANQSNGPVVVTPRRRGVDAEPQGKPAPADLQPSSTNSVLDTGATDVVSTNGTAVTTDSTNAPYAAQIALASLAQKVEVKDVRKSAAREIRTFIQNTRSGALGATGSIALVVLAILMLARIEDTFNDIWGVVRGRSWFLRVVLYWSVITLAPLLLIGTLALASGPHLDTTRELLTQMPFIGSLVFQFLPVIMLWLAFSGFYMLVPNTKVEWTAALAGGLLCAVLWHLNNFLSVMYVSRVVTNFKIYGSLGMVPVFMAGLYLSWLFLLLGAQVAYAWQNRTAYLQEKLAERVDQRGREFVALRLMTCVGQYFQAGEPAAGVAEMSATLGVPSRLTQQIMQQLKAAHLVSEVAGAEVAYLPARPLETITCHDILLAMRTTNGQQLPRRDEPATNEVLGEFERIQAAERAAASSVSLLALVNRAQARLRLAAPLAVEPEIAPLNKLAEPDKPQKPNAPEAIPVIEPLATPAPTAESKTAPASPPPPESVPTKPPSPIQPTKDDERSFPL